MLNKLHLLTSEIENELDNNHLGWGFGYDEEFGKFFLSIFDPNNFSEELLFLLKVENDSLKVFKGIRFKATGAEVKIQPEHRFFVKSQEIAKNIQEKFLDESMISL